MLKRSKAISIVLAFVFCMTFLAPALVAPAVAQAGTAITYSAVNTPTVTTDSQEQLINAKVLIDVSDSVVFDKVYEDFVSVKLPSGVEIGDKSDMAFEEQGNTLLVTDYSVASSSTIDLKVKRADKATTDDTKLLLTFINLKVKSGSGNLDITFAPPSGSPFPAGTLTIAKIAGSGATNTSVASIKDIGDGTSALDTITIEELVAKTIKKDDQIKISLPKGYEWANPAASFEENGETKIAKATGGWAFAGKDIFDLDKVNDRDMLVKVTAAPATTTAGKIEIDNLRVVTTDSANYGEVEVSIDCSQNSDITEQDVVVANYAQYGVTIEEGTVEEVTSGRTEQELGTFFIKESIKGSLLEGRTIKLELPKGVKWLVAEETDGDKVVKKDYLKAGELEVIDGDGNLAVTRSGWKVESSSKDRVIKTTVEKFSTEATELKFKKAQVKIEPGFEGPIEIKVYGTAGAEGTVKVAEAVKPVKFTADNVTDIVIGQANQKVADMVITENIKEAILDEAKNDSNLIVIGLEEGYKFSSKPTVEVEEGNLEIDSTKLQNNDTELKIEIKYSSTKPSTIRISDVYVTALRYVPVGPMKATLVEATDWNTVDAAGSTALVDWATDKSAGDVVIANCVTPAEGAGSSEFRIGSNIYSVNGVSKIMDCAPYIKGDRTYVPVRYLAYALGITEDNVVWDAAAQKVTLTQDDNVVELTIGSTTLYVNGEAVAMDVAPEITNDRTMLPARYVAEGFGFNVGWDAFSQTVFVGK